jgi:hypothetical protein
MHSRPRSSNLKMGAFKADGLSSSQYALAGQSAGRQDGYDFALFHDKSISGNALKALGMVIGTAGCR